MDLTSVGEKVMRTSWVTALLTFRSSTFSPASPLCSAGPADCSNLQGRGAVGRWPRGADPSSPAVATPSHYLSQRSRRQAQAGLLEHPSSGQCRGKSGLGVQSPCSSSTSVSQQWF